MLKKRIYKDRYYKQEDQDALDLRNDDRYELIQERYNPEPDPFVAWFFVGFNREPLAPDSES